MVMLPAWVLLVWLASSILGAFLCGRSAIQLLEIASLRRHVRALEKCIDDDNCPVTDEQIEAARDAMPYLDDPEDM